MASTVTEEAGIVGPQDRRAGLVGTSDGTAVRQCLTAAIEAASSASFSWWVMVSLTELSRQPSGVRTATSS